MMRFSPDHPRSRGVYIDQGAMMRIGEGSSPLARGLLGETLSVKDIIGIIPARAGFTSTTGRRQGHLPDHPRSRGVYGGISNSNESYTGSSPLARGLHTTVSGNAQFYRIIPARAGFTTTRASAPPRRPDHPRSRGVYATLRLSSPWAWGSSPLARGLLEEADLTACEAGIIPARAGFTEGRGVAFARLWDHPRSRGVYASAAEARP